MECYYVMGEYGPVAYQYIFRYVVAVNEFRAKLIFKSWAKRTRPDLWNNIGLHNVDAIAVNDEKGVVEVVALEDCIECHSCQQNCPEDAIVVYPLVEDSLRNL